MRPTRIPSPRAPTAIAWWRGSRPGPLSRRHRRCSRPSISSGNKDGAAHRRRARESLRARRSATDLATPYRVARARVTGASPSSPMCGPRCSSRAPRALGVARAAGRARCQVWGLARGGSRRDWPRCSSHLPCSMRRRHSPKRAVVKPPRCVLDSGGLTALVGGSQRAREWLRWVIEHDGAICVTHADPGREHNGRRSSRCGGQSHSRRA